MLRLISQLMYLICLTPKSFSIKYICSMTLLKELFFYRLSGDARCLRALIDCCDIENERLLFNCVNNYVNFNNNHEKKSKSVTKKPHTQKHPKIISIRRICLIQFKLPSVHKMLSVVR